MRRFYIASSLSNRAKVSHLRDVLVSKGWNHTYDWTKNAPPITKEELHAIGLAEMKGVQSADLLIALLPGGKGTHIEIGLALAQKIPILLYSEDEATFELENLSTFYLMDGIRRIVGTQEDLIRAIESLQ